MKRKNHILLLVIAVMLMLGAAGCSKETDKDRIDFATEESGEESQNTENTGSSDRLEDTKNEESTESGETPAHAVGSMTDDYILPEVQSYVYTLEELSVLSKEELRIARNEIYARHGRRFKSADLETHFTNKGWYQPSVNADDFDDGLLNQMERDNLKAVKAAEERVDLAVIACPKIGSDEFPKIDGSTATLPLSQALYRLSSGASAREAESRISHDKTTQAYLNLMWKQETDLVIAYAPGDAVKTRLKETDNIIMKPIGRDALVFMANDGNPTKSLTQKQIVDIYTGKLTNWKAVGGKNQAIKAFQRPKDSGSQNLMEKLVMNEIPMAKAPQDFMISEMGELIDRVSSYDNTGDALGYSVYFYAKNMYQKPGLKFMGVDGVMPSTDTIRDGSYPYVSDFYAAIRKDEPKDSAAYQLFEWLTTEDGQALINALGYVGMSNAEKTLPLGFESEEEFNAKISLPSGTVILADGAYLYGESGIGIFDETMHLKKFIRHVSASEVATFSAFDENSFLCMQDTLSGLYGVYSIKEGGWVCRPEYTNAFQTRDGFCLERAVYKEGADGTVSWSYTYDYADKKGTIIRAGVPSEEKIWSDEDGDSTYLGRDEFARAYPEILNRLGVMPDDITIYATEFLEGVVVITKKNRVYYYNMSGKLLFEFDTDQLKGMGKSNSFPVIVNDSLSYLQAYSEDSDIKRYYVYRDGVLIKEMEINDMRNGNISVKDGFYLRIIGNYLYIYNFDDEPCAKFLLGYYTDD